MAVAEYFERPPNELTFGRFAPNPVSHPIADTETDGLADALEAIRLSVEVFFGSLTIAARILWHRGMVWTDTRVLRSLPVAWALSGVGWGGLASLCVFQFI